VRSSRRRRCQREGKPMQTNLAERIALVTGRAAASGRSCRVLAANGALSCWRRAALSG